MWKLPCKSFGKCASLRNKIGAKILKFWIYRLYEITEYVFNWELLGDFNTLFSFINASGHAESFVLFCFFPKVGIFNKLVFLLQVNFKWKNLEMLAYNNAVWMKSSFTWILMVKNKILLCVECAKIEVKNWKRWGAFIRVTAFFQIVVFLLFSYVLLYNF